MGRVRNGNRKSGAPANESLRQLRLFDTPEAYTQWLEGHLRELSAGQQQAQAERKQEIRAARLESRPGKREQQRRAIEQITDDSKPLANWYIGDAAFVDGKEVRILVIMPIKGLAKVRPRNSRRVGAQRWVPLAHLQPQPKRTAGAKTWQDVSNETGDILKGWEPTKRPRPTLSPPGSPDRIAVYAGRIERGEQLFSDLDASIYDVEQPPDDWDVEDPTDEQLRREARNNSKNIHLPTFDFRGSNKIRTRKTQAKTA